MSLLSGAGGVIDLAAKPTSVQDILSTRTQLVVSDLDQRKGTLQSWKNLEEEIRDIYELIAEFSSIVVTVSQPCRRMNKRFAIYISALRRTACRRTRCSGWRACRTAVASARVSCPRAPSTPWPALSSARASVAPSGSSRESRSEDSPQ